MFLSDVSIKRPVFATMLMVALLVFGLVSYQRLAIDEYPDVTYPTISVNTSFPGASPAVMERDVSRPLEEALNTVQGIREVTSTSSEGNSSVRVNMHLAVNVMEAQQDVVAKVARIRRSLPPDVQAWNDWPARQPSLLFAGLAFREVKYLELWEKLPADPTDAEVRRNIAITQPILWLAPTK